MVSILHRANQWERAKMKQATGATVPCVVKMETLSIGTTSNAMTRQQLQQRRLP